MADALKRYVVGLDENGKSALLMDGVPNQQEQEDFFWRATLWKTRETPVDNSIPVTARSTETFRSIAIPERHAGAGGRVLARPRPRDNSQVWVDLNKMTGYTQVLRAGTSREPVEKQPAPKLIGAA